jgi:hypothetical protein
MMKFGAWAIVATVLLSGCGATPVAPMASSASVAESEASNFLDSIKPFADTVGRGDKLGVKFDVSSITGHQENEDRITLSTDNGKTGQVSPLLLGKDGNLYFERPTATPRVYTYHRLGSYTVKGAIAPHAAVTCKFTGGAKLKSKRGLPIPMLNYSYVMLTLSDLPAAEKTEPTWVTVK